MTVPRPPWWSPAGLAEADVNDRLERAAREAATATGAPIAFWILRHDRPSRYRGAVGLVAVAPSLLDLVVSAKGIACTDVGASAVAGEYSEISDIGAASFVGAPVVDAEGATVGALVVADRGVHPWSVGAVETLRVIAEIAVRALEARVDEPAGIEGRLHDPEVYRQLLERSSDAVIIVSDGRVVLANPAFAKLAGRAEAADVLGVSISTLLDRPFLKAVRSEILGTPRDHEVAEQTSVDTLRRLDGDERLVEVSAVPFLRAGEPAIQMILRDVSLRRPAERARREAESRLNLLLGQTPAAFWSTNEQLRVTSALGVGARAARFLESIGEDVAELFDLANREEVLTAHRKALGGERASLAIEWDGRAFEVRVDPLRSAAGGIIGTVGIALDVTERKEAETRREAMHLDALLQVAGGVAHEMNNALAVITGSASLLERGPSFPAELHGMTEAILSASRHGRDVVANLLGFARGGRYRRERFLLNSLARDAAQWVQQQASAGVAVELQLSATLMPVEGDPVQVLAAVENLVQNALDASRPGGNITITTRTLDVSSPSPSAPALLPGTYAVIEVSDEGTGMTEEVRRRALEPFFTTKAVGAGPGLGLSMAYGVARNHGGTLLIASEPGRGTTVTMCLPAASVVPIEAPPPVLQLPPALRLAERPAVLVIDDDEWVRFSTRGLLDALGFDVVEAESGPIGLARFQERGGRFAAVILDLRMPGMDGEQVLRRLVAIDPAVSVLLCSGYARDQVGHQLFVLGNVGFLGKPFTIVELEQQLRALGVEMPSVVAPG